MSSTICFKLDQSKMLSAGNGLNNKQMDNFFLQGILFAMPDCAKTPLELVRLWLHEANRVYRDKMVDKTDMDLYDKIERDMVKKCFEVLYGSNIHHTSQRPYLNLYRTITTFNDLEKAVF